MHPSRPVPPNHGGIINEGGKRLVSVAACGQLFRLQVTGGKKEATGLRHAGREGALCKAVFPRVFRSIAFHEVA